MTIDEGKVSGRVGDWMQTFSGRQFWPIDPHVDEIAEEHGWLALDRFQSVLRQRDAAPALAKGFGAAAKKATTDWFVGKLRAIGSGELTANECEDRIQGDRANVGGGGRGGEETARVSFKCNVCNVNVHAADTLAHAEQHVENTFTEIRALMSSLSAIERRSILGEWCPSCGWRLPEHAARCDAR